MIELILTCWFGGINSGDIDLMKSIYSDNVLFHGKSGDKVGPDAIRDVAKTWRNSFENFEMIPLHTSIETIKGNEVVVVHWKGVGKMVDAIREHGPTHELANIHGITFFGLNKAQDKVIEHWASIDYRPLQSSKAS